MVPTTLESGNMDEKIDKKKFAKKLNSQGAKVNYLRRLAGLSRGEFAEKYNISESTLRSWEFDITPISDKLMERFLKGLLQEGISISSEWMRGNSGEFLTFLATHEQKKFSNIKEEGYNDPYKLDRYIREI